MILRVFVFGLFCISATPLVGQAFQIESKISLPSQSLIELQQDDISIEKRSNKVDVNLNGKLFMTFEFGKYSKPIFYPIYGPDQISMTRDWPMKDNTEGESKDHPHHKSMWISHEISGVDFWSEKGGTVVSELIETKFEGNPTNVFWAKPIDVFFRVNSKNNLIFVDMRRQRKLYYKPIDSRVFI